MQAHEVMTRNLETRTVKATIADVIETMSARDIRHLPIVSGDELVGMISDRDLRQFSADLISNGASAKAQLQTPIGKLMSSDVLTAEPDDDVDEVIELMIDNKVGAVPIVDPDGALVGIVSYVDILRAASGRLG